MGPALDRATDKSGESGLWLYAEERTAWFAPGGVREFTTQCSEFCARRSGVTKSEFPPPALRGPTDVLEAYTAIPLRVDDLPAMRAVQERVRSRLAQPSDLRSCHRTARAAPSTRRTDGAWCAACWRALASRAATHLVGWSTSTPCAPPPRPAWLDVACRASRRSTGARACVAGDDREGCVHATWGGRPAGGRWRA